MVENKRVLTVFVLLNIFKELWEAFSNEPVVTGVFKMFNLDSVSDAAIFLSRYWLLILSIGILLWIYTPQIWRKIKGLETITGKHFANQIVILDGKRFEDCYFENCTFRWMGGEFANNHAKIKGGVYFMFDNKTAADTLKVMKDFGVLQQEVAETVRTFQRREDFEKGIPYQQPKTQMEQPKPQGKQMNPGKRKRR